ncbi:MAG: hypothetical protein Q4E07_00140 [Eubacteriales bacterium]|nr:hypothetical protein [Eubacteriales bacterium]
MKKLLTLLLVLCMLIPTAFVGATELKQEDMLDWKLSKQISNGSGLQLKLIFGEESILPDTELPENIEGLLSVLTRGTSLQLNYLTAAFGAQKGRQEIRLNLSKDDKTLTHINYRSDGTLEALSSPLLGKDTYLSAQGESAAILLGKDAQNTWPDITRLMVSVYTSDNEWKTVLNNMLLPYQNDIANLIQQNTQISTETNEDGSVNTVTQLTIPAVNIKGSMAEQLRRFYQDEQLLTHLKQKATIREQNAFLNPLMLEPILQAVNALELEGDVSVKRSFSKDGTLVYDSVVLPMGGAKGLKQISYLYNALDKEGNTAITLDYIGGAYKAFSYKDLKTDANSGSLTGVLKQKSDENAIETQTDIKVDYLRNNPVYDAQIDKYSQDYSANIMIHEKDKKANIIELNVKLVSGANPRSATNITGDISWAKEGQEGKLTAAIEGASTPPWSIAAIEEGEYLRTEELSEEQLKKLAESIQLNLAALVAGLSLINMSTAAPANN